jgi:omega-6 fatty acid desaturase (delta-12 desaturase)
MVEKAGNTGARIIGNTETSYLTLECQISNNMWVEAFLLSQNAATLYPVEVRSRALPKESMQTMTESPNTIEPCVSLHDQWRALVAKYQAPSHTRSAWQLCNTFVPYFAMMALMYLTLDYSFLLTLALSVPTAGFLVRIFIISHDCGHGSFFKSKRANELVGSFASLLCWTPYYYWKHEHALHHASMGNLDKRGHGDIWTMTVEEYRAASWKKRVAYRIYRSPLVLFGIGSFYLFVVEYRVPPKGGTDKDRLSVWRTNLALAVLLLIMSYTIGLPAFFMIQAPVFFLAAAAGTWLFYVQHQFEDAYWERDDQWDFVDGSMKGSSYYRLPKVLQWFTGNIGLHHIHHLSSKIPNYYLESCHKENEALQQVHQLTLWSSLACLRFRLLDEKSGILLSFSDARKLYGPNLDTAN